MSERSSGLGFIILYSTPDLQQYLVGLYNLETSIYISSSAYLKYILFILYILSPSYTQFEAVKNSLAMSLSLRPAIASDARHIVDIYLSAFREDAISLLCFPRNKAVDDFWLNMIAEELSNPHTHFVCVTSSDASGQETVIAFAQWMAPSNPVTVELPTWPAGSDSELANSFFGALFSTHKRLMEGKKHWYLELLGTRPEFQGKGAAGMLMRWGLERADEEGVEAYLEASPDGKPIYEHFGFVAQEELVVDLEGKGLGDKKFVEVFMVRPVKDKR